MKTVKSIFFIFLLFPLIASCELDSLFPEEELITVNIVLENSSGISGCGSAESSITFIVSHDSFYEDINVSKGSSRSIDVKVFDRQRITVIVQRTSNDQKIAESYVDVRTDSRPDDLNGTQRKIEYCTVFDLIFDGF